MRISFRGGSLDHDPGTLTIRSSSSPGRGELVLVAGRRRRPGLEPASPAIGETLARAPRGPRSSVARRRVDRAIRSWWSAPVDHETNSPIGEQSKYCVDLPHANRW
jgi:hypothetical protein